ncbi:MAG TPA: hypothetical protein VK206_12285, partial [Anaerolineales bacterium]|nr:hypothetical protein [Anaerolineales bacterium]
MPDSARFDCVPLHLPSHSATLRGRFAVAGGARECIRHSAQREDLYVRIICKNTISNDRISFGANMEMLNYINGAWVKPEVAEYLE